MPPITIHSKSPISASTAAAKGKDASTPQTDQALNQQAPAAASAPTTTGNGTSEVGYPPPQPGQPPVPAPTASFNQPYPLQQPPPPTRTTQLANPELVSDNNPPPPQPSAVPVPPISTMPQTSHDYHQPPSAGSAPPPQPMMQQLPPQLSMAPPATNQAPTYSTTTAQPNPSYYAQPTNPMQQPATDLSHPPGYQQDPRAAEMTAAQRMAQEQAKREDSVLTRLAEAGSSSTIGGAPGAPGTPGAMEGSMGNDSSSTGQTTAQNVMNSSAEMGGAAWDAAKKFMGGVAEKAVEIEGEVWKRVNR